MRPLLIAGNNRAWLTGVAASLDESGYRVETADGGVECMAKLRSARPQTLILDAALLWGGSDGVLAYLGEEYSDGARPTVLLIGEFANHRSVPRLPHWVRQLRTPISMVTILEAVRRSADGSH
jgi:ActR/RegA family two-component response regulator